MAWQNLGFSRRAQSRADNKKQWQKMGVSKNRGTPKWMVYTGKPY